MSKLKGISLLGYYFSNRNRLFLILRYFHGLYLIKALIISVIVILFHIFTRPPILRRALIRVLLALLKYFRRNIEIRCKYIKLVKERKVLERFVMKWPIAQVPQRVAK